MTMKRWQHAALIAMGCIISVGLVFCLASAIVEYNEGCSLVHPCAVSQ